MSQPRAQSTFFKGIYEFDDPSGTLLAGRVPAHGTAALYNGTAVVVKPNQCAIFIYKGQIADVFFAGTHMIKTETVPLLSALANWSFGFENPLLCELIFISGQSFTARRWGTPQPVLTKFQNYGVVPIRAFGNFNLAVKDPRLFYTKLMGSRGVYSVADIEEFLQGQIVELLPEALEEVQSLESLASSYNAISKNLEIALTTEIGAYGLAVEKVQVLSALPSQEVLEAMEARTAIQILGSQKEYLLYKAANSLGQPNDGTANDPLQMMMGLMLGKGLLGNDYHDKEKVPAGAIAMACTGCQTPLAEGARFCAQCGKKVA